jgi:hypothetical protein
VSRKQSDATKVRVLRKTLRMLLYYAERAECSDEEEKDDLRYACGKARSWAQMPLPAARRQGGGEG